MYLAAFKELKVLIFGLVIQAWYFIIVRAGQFLLSKDFSFVPGSFISRGNHQAGAWWQCTSTTTHHRSLHHDPPHTHNKLTNKQTPQINLKLVNKQINIYKSITHHIYGLNSCLSSLFYWQGSNLGKKSSRLQELYLQESKWEEHYLQPSHLSCFCIKH